jgi:hypothetical protein
MPTVSLLFEPLYFLESPELAIVEIKRNDLGDDTAREDQFRWLLITKCDFNVIALTFDCMDSAADIEERFFAEGFLKFGLQNGTYIAKFNSAQHQLLRRRVTELSATLSLAVLNYLSRR